jgi:hypothetical protein
VIRAEVLPLPHPFPGFNKVEQAIGSNAGRLFLIIISISVMTSRSRFRLAQRSANLPSRLKVKGRLGEAPQSVERRMSQIVGSSGVALSASSRSGFGRRLPARPTARAVPHSRNKGSHSHACPIIPGRS